MKKRETLHFRADFFLICPRAPTYRDKESSTWSLLVRATSFAAALTDLWHQLTG